MSHIVEVTYHTDYDRDKDVYYGVVRYKTSEGKVWKFGTGLYSSHTTALGRAKAKARELASASHVTARLSTSEERKRERKSLWTRLKNLWRK